jgi:hypothetical protein
MCENGELVPKAALASVEQSVRKILVDLQSLARGPTGKRRLPSLPLAAVTSVASILDNSTTSHTHRQHRFGTSRSFAHILFTECKHTQPELKSPIAPSRYSDQPLSKHAGGHEAKKHSRQQARYYSCGNIAPRSLHRHTPLPSFHLPTLLRTAHIGFPPDLCCCHSSPRRVSRNVHATRLASDSSRFDFRSASTTLHGLPQIVGHRYNGAVFQATTAE